MRAGDEREFPSVEAARLERAGHIDRIVRQIERRAQRITQTAHIKHRSFRRICPAWGRDNDRQFRAHIERLTFERRGEIDGLMREAGRAQAVGLLDDDGGYDQQTDAVQTELP